MTTLVVGGTGIIGGYIALRLRERGEAVAIASRTPPPAGSPLAGIPFIRGDYTKGELLRDEIAPFDTIIFSAAVDSRKVRHELPRAEQDAYYLHVNGELVPEFYRRARAAGVRRIAYIGSFYPQARPQLVDRFAYVRSRALADERIRSLASDDFMVVNLNAPAILGAEPAMLGARPTDLARMALGKDVGQPVFAPVGGMNMMSVRSLYEAVVGALARGENGRGYLVGDENLLYVDLLRLYFAAAGRGDVDIPVLDRPSPFVGSPWAPSDEAPIFYEPEAADLLRYRRQDIARTVQEIVDHVRAAGT